MYLRLSQLLQFSWLVVEVVTQAEAIFKFDEKVLEDFVQNIGTDAAVEDIVVVKLQAADNNMESIIVKAAEEVTKLKMRRPLLYWKAF